jgi:hypothetical protein
MRRYSYSRIRKKSTFMRFICFIQIHSGMWSGWDNDESFVISEIWSESNAWRR